jgi:dihydropteroate synthase
MDNTAQFVSDLNVARFVDRLRLEHDPAMRALLQGLLLKEMKDLGCDCKHLGNVVRQIAEGRRRIEIQNGVIESLTISDRDVGPAKNTLRNLVEIQRIFEQYRHAILDAAERKRAMGMTLPRGAKGDWAGVNAGKADAAGLTASTNDRHEVIAVTQASQPPRRLWRLVRRRRRRGNGEGGGRRDL